MSSLTFVMILQTDEEQYGNKESQNLIFHALESSSVTKFTFLAKVYYRYGNVALQFESQGRHYSNWDTYLQRNTSSNYSITI